MQKVFCFESLFLFELCSPLDISPSFFQKKKKKLKAPYPFEVCLCVLNFMVIGHYTINTPENFQAFTIFSVWRKNNWQIRRLGPDDGI